MAFGGREIGQQIERILTACKCLLPYPMLWISPLLNMGSSKVAHSSPILAAFVEAMTEITPLSSKSLLGRL